MKYPIRYLSETYSCCGCSVPIVYRQEAEDTPLKCEECGCDAPTSFIPGTVSYAPSRGRDSGEPKVEVES